MAYGALTYYAAVDITQGHPGVNKEQEIPCYTFTYQFNYI